MNRLQAWPLIAVLAVFATACASTQMKNKPSVEEVDFGKLPDGRVVKRFELKNRNGAFARVMTYGATREEAIRNTELLAIDVIADRIEHGELPATALNVSFQVLREQLAGD